METHSRTVAKTLSWRVLATIITACLVWILTGKLELGLSIGVMDCLTKIVIYYFHERMWSKVRFGYVRETAVYRHEGC